MRMYVSLSLFPQVVREIPAGPVALTQICLSRSGRMMFAGTSSGVVRAVKFPLGETGEWQEYQAHNGPISKVWVLSKRECILHIRTYVCSYI